MCANVNILSGRRSISRSGLHSNMMNFQLFLYTLSKSFMKTKFKKKNPPWSAIVSSLQCFVIIVLGFHENYHLIPYTSINLFHCYWPSFWTMLGCALHFSPWLFWLENQIAELQSEKPNCAVANAEIPSLSYRSGCCMMKESNSWKEVTTTSVGVFNDVANIWLRSVAWGHDINEPQSPNTAQSASCLYLVLYFLLTNQFGVDVKVS